jgi:hypothetical protein
MSEPSVLRGLLAAYADGDLLARRALLDLLQEEDDGRLEAVRAEAIDWDAVARGVCPGVDRSRERSPVRPYASASHGGYNDDLPRYRWFVDCARVGADALPEVVRAVRAARRRWLRELFPEVELVPDG